MKFLFLLLLTDLGGRRVQTGSNSTICFLAMSSHNKSDLCGEHSSDLTCEDDLVIMIKTVMYQKKKGPNNNKCDDCGSDGKWQDWDIHPTLFQHILYGTCSKKHKCSFDGAVEAPSNKQRYIWNARVMYECVKEEFIRNVCSPLETILGDEPLHLALHQNTSLPQTCSCIIEATYSGILVVDYRPYINDFCCADSSVFIDDRLFFPCDSETTGIDASVYNYALNVTNNSTNITISIQTMPMMFWIYIEGTENLTVSCDTSTPQSTTTSVTSSDSTITSTTTATSRMSTDRVTMTQEITSETQTTQSLSEQGDSDAVGMSLSAIIGGVLGSLLFLVIFVITVCFVYKRRLRKKAKTKYNEDTYNSVLFERTKTKKSKHVGTISNQSYAIPIDCITNNLSVASDGRKKAEGGSSNVVNVEVGGAYTEVEDILNYQQSKENKTSDYEEPYQDFSDQNENNSTLFYAKPIKGNNDHGAYSTLAGLDTYSHTPGFTEKITMPDEKYSHIKVKQNKAFYVNPGKSIDLYSHLTPAASTNADPDRVEKENDEENYDHLGQL